MAGTTEKARRLNRENQARWRQRHAAEIAARREAERAARCAAMEAANPWTKNLVSLSELPLPPAPGHKRKRSKKCS
jgi:hypothetical protein